MRKFLLASGVLLVAITNVEAASTGTGTMHGFFRQLIIWVKLLRLIQRAMTHLGWSWLLMGKLVGCMTEGKNIVITTGV